MSHNTVLASIFGGLAAAFSAVVTFFTPSAACLVDSLDAAGNQLHQLNDTATRLLDMINCSVPLLLFAAKMVGVWLGITAICLIVLTIATCIKRHKTTVVLPTIDPPITNPLPLPQVLETTVPITLPSEPATLEDVVTPTVDLDDKPDTEV